MQKKILLAIIVICFLTLGYLFLFSAKGLTLWNRSVAHPHQLNHQQLIEQHLHFDLQVSAGSIIMFGNSITYEVNWNELFSRGDIINRGIPGDQIANIIRRAATHSSSDNTIVVMGGINDFLAGASPEVIFTEFQKLINTSIAPGKLIVLNTIHTHNNHVINKRIETLNRKLQKLCTTQQIDFIDLNTKLAPNGNLKKDFTYDGIHLNITGYLIIKQLLDSHLPPIKKE
jgi:lysophospholipase L1-like esterase